MSEKKLNGEISIQKGDFSILNGENYLWSLFFKKKVQNTSEKNWMEKSPFRMEKSAAFFFWETFFICIFIFCKKKWWKRFSKKVNGDFSILNGEKFLENNLQRIFKKKVENASEKFERRNLHSEWRNLHSLFLRSVLHPFFQQKKRFFTSKVVEKRLFYFFEWRWFFNIFFGLADRK